MLALGTAHSAAPVRGVRQLYNRTLPICPLLSRTERQVGLLGGGLSGTRGHRCPLTPHHSWRLSPGVGRPAVPTIGTSFNDVVFGRPSPPPPPPSNPNPTAHATVPRCSLRGSVRKSVDARDCARGAARVCVRGLCAPLYL